MGSSRGIYQDNLVYNDSLFNKLKDSLEKYDPPIMIMDYRRQRIYCWSH